MDIQATTEVVRAGWTLTLTEDEAESILQSLDGWMLGTQAMLRLRATLRTRGELG